MEFEVKLPILGFENIQNVRLVKIDDVFMKLEVINDANISFTLINPYVLREYSFDIPIFAKTMLDLEEGSNVLVFNIMIVHKPIENSTVNFIAPVIFNIDKNICGQIVLDSSQYPDFGITEPISEFIKK